MTNPGGLEDFVSGWTTDPLAMKPTFIEYLDFLRNQPGTELDFKMRPGVSYSLRARNAAQKGRDLFVLVDVVDDDPDERWLSVCFYADLVSDPDEFGDFVPGGLLGEDALCFNLDADDMAMRGYILDRIKEASTNASR